jgi:hypothetical protein
LFYAKVMPACNLGMATLDHSSGSTKWFQAAASGEYAAKTAMMIAMAPCGAGRRFKQHRDYGLRGTTSSRNVQRDVRGFNSCRARQKIKIDRRSPSRCGIRIALRRTDSAQPPVRTYVHVDEVHSF